MTIDILNILWIIVAGSIAALIALVLAIFFIILYDENLRGKDFASLVKELFKPK